MRARTLAAAVLPHVDVGRELDGFAIGLRDRALLALVASGVSCAEIARLTCKAISAEAGRLVVTVQRDVWLCRCILGHQESSSLMAWLSETRTYGTGQPLFVTSRQRPLSRVALHAIIARYQPRAA